MSLPHPAVRSLLLVWLCGACGCAAAATDDTAAMAPAAHGVNGADGADGAWTAVDGLSDVQGLYPSSVEPAVVYVADGHGLWRSQDYGASFTPCAATDGSGRDLPGPVTALAIDPLRPARLYAGTDGHGVLISEDQGAHWVASGMAADARIDSLVFAPSDRSCATLYATHGLEHGGLSRSQDAGAHWQEVDADYGISGLVVLDDALFCGARTAAQGDGFYRYDASKGWYCVLPESPRVVLASPADPARLWFSTDHGIACSDNAGISTHRVGPPDIDVESMAIALTGPGTETVYAFAPQQTGVIASRDGFATWQALTNGLPPSTWTQEGSRLAVSCDGAALYASANGVLYRIDRSNQPAYQLPVEVLPAVTVAGGGPLVIATRSHPGDTVVADCSALGGPAALALHDDGLDGDELAGDGLFSARLDVLDAALVPGSKVVPVRATATGGSALRSGRAVVRVLPGAADAVLWDASRTGALAARCTGAWSCTASVPAQGPPQLLLHCAGPGTMVLPFMNPWESAIAVRDHAVLTFAIRATQPTAMAFALRVHDNGQGSGPENAQASRSVALATVLATLDAHLQIVSIPLDDLLADSPCSPNLIDCELSATDAVHGDFVLLPMRVLAQPGPSIAQLTILPQDPHHLALRCSAWGRSVAPTLATMRINRTAVALVRTQCLSAGCAIPADWYDPALQGEAAMAATASWSGSIDTTTLTPGEHHLELVLGDPQGLTITTVRFTVPAAPYAVIPGLDGADAASRHAALDASAAYVLGSAAQGLSAQLVWEPEQLDLRLSVHDNGGPAVQVPPGVGPAALGDQPQAELFIRPAASDSVLRHLQVVWTTAGPCAWCDGTTVPCTGQRSADGYVVELQAPIALSPAGAPAGTGLVHRYAQLTTADHHLLGFRHADQAGTAVDDLAQLGEPGGGGAWRATTHTNHEITVSAPGLLTAAAAALAAWTVNGHAPEAVVIASDRRHVALFASAWPDGAVTITGPAPAPAGTPAPLPADGASGCPCP